MTTFNPFATQLPPITGRVPADFEANAWALRKFWSTKHRWPIASASNESERQLATWHDTQRQHLKTSFGRPFAVERLAYLDVLAPGWRNRNSQGRGATFEDHVLMLNQFWTNNNKWPSTVAKDKFERHLGQWLHNQRRYLRTGTEATFTAERAAYLDWVAPGWAPKNRPTSEETFRATAQLLVTFRRNNNRWPKTTATEKSEQQLGEWLHNQRRYDKSGKNTAFTTERANRLDVVTPGWRKR